jgi:hypothetical protein
VLFIVCHLRDIETIFMGRAGDLLDSPGATFQVVPNDVLIERGDYANQNMRVALAEYGARRAAFIALLEPLADEQWLLAGTHPEQGPATMLDVAINGGLHDTDHIEQLVRCLGQGVREA